MTSIENVNYKYFGMAVVFLILTYYYLNNIKSEIYMKKINENSEDKIYITTNGGKVAMDNNVFENHMNRIKKNITNLQHNFSEKNCTVMKKHIDSAKNQTKRYIDLNKDNIDSDFCNLDSKLKMIDDNILKERELLKNKMIGNRKTELDDEETDEVDNIRYSILELLIDIDIIMFLVRSSVCKKGEIDLSALDNIILELYEKNCTNKPINTNKEGFTDNFTQETFNAALNILSDTPADKISNSILSQDITDSEIILKREMFNQSINNQVDTKLTHGSNEEFTDDNQINENIYKIFNNVNVVKWRQNYDIKELGIHDNQSRSSLM
jgi:hypothetical protein